ncbi:TerB family tellurite resistance protein [Maribacter sp.]|nr:TerB family tellurite resistance protein [Maribacter sp.]
MQTDIIEYSLAEKLAIVKMVDSVILVDELVHKAEMSALQLLMKRIDFDSNFILQSRNIAYEQCLTILDEMSILKKNDLSTQLHEMANADGFFHKKEMALIFDICSSIGLETKTGK